MKHVLQVMIVLFSPELEKQRRVLLLSTLCCFTQLSHSECNNSIIVDVVVVVRLLLYVYLWLAN